MLSKFSSNLNDEIFVLLDDYSSNDAQCVLYTEPVDFIVVSTPDQIEAGLEKLQGASARGLHAAGYLAYELGYLLEPTLAPLWPGPGELPLMWFGLFQNKQTFMPDAFQKVFNLSDSPTYQVGKMQPSIDRDRYLADAARVKDYLAAGDIYQVNYTFNLHFDFSGDALAFYADLRRKQHAAHGALIWAPEFRVLSSSPEMFVSIEDHHIKARPMKGTLPRSVSLEEDRIACEEFRQDEKSRAENLMIVDLLRNDIGRIAEIGSVKVTDLFQIETYPTLHQMTSTIEATLRDDVSVPDVINQTFPCGSVTGAPKVRAMEIIRELEAEPRGVYTGSVGAFDADGSVRLNVAIRTVTLTDKNFSKGVLGIGSAIVYDSSNEAEYDECLLKAKYLTAAPLHFKLLETMAWHPDEGFVLLEEHLQRICSSAEYFGNNVSREALLRKLNDIEKPNDQSLRLRLLVDVDGKIEIETFPLEASSDTEITCVLWDVPVHTQNPFLYHKTTEREFFDQAYDSAGMGEVLFVNQRGELTEGSRTTIFIERGNVILTPPLECGLLNGTLRRKLLSDGLYDGMPVREKILTPQDLESADVLYLGNSVRGMQRARFISSRQQV